MMFKLIKYEMMKLFSKKSLMIFLALLCCVNMGVFIYTQNLDQTISISAYQKLQTKLDQIPNEKRYIFVETEYEKYNAFEVIEQLITLRIHPQDNQFMIESLLNDYPDVEKKYGELYQQDHTPYYTDYLESDVQFLSHIIDEFEVLYQYPQYIQDIQDKAKTLSGISIFQHDNNSFEQKNIVKTAEDYQKLQNIKLTYTSEKGIVEALSFPITNFFIMLAMMILAMRIIIDEKEKKLFSIIKLTARGQHQIMLSKIITLICSVSIIVFLMAGSQLFYSSMTYGLGDLTRSIQSLASFSSYPYALNVFQFLMLCLLIKCFAACVIGLFMIEMAILCQNKITLLLGTTFFLIIEYILYLVIPSLSSFFIMKYFNVITVLQTDTLFQLYRNINFLSNPLSMHIFIIIGFLIIFLILIIINCFTYRYRRNMSLQSLDISFFYFKRYPSLSLIKQEFYKVFVIQKVWILCFLCIGIQFYQYHDLSVYLDSDTQIYQAYMKSLEGPLTQEKEEYILQEQKNYEQLHSQLMNINEKESQGIITKAQAIRMKDDIEQQLLGENVFQKIYDQYQDIKIHPQKQFVFNQAYQQFFLETSWTMMPTLLLFVMIIIGLSSCMTYDYQNQMHHVTQSTLKGNHKLLIMKFGIMNVICLLFYMFVTIPPLILLHQTYGFSSLDASITSLPAFSSFPVWMSIGVGCFLSLLLRFYAVICLGLIIQGIAVKTRNYLMTLFVSLFLFLVPLLLAYGGFDLLNSISLYPLLFHGQLIETTGGLFQILFSIIGYSMLFFLSLKYIFNNYKPQNI